MLDEVALHATRPRVWPAGPTAGTRSPPARTRWPARRSRRRSAPAGSGVIELLDAVHDRHRGPGHEQPERGEQRPHVGFPAVAERVRGVGRAAGPPVGDQQEDLVAGVRPGMRRLGQQRRRPGHHGGGRLRHRDEHVGDERDQHRGEALRLAGTAQQRHHRERVPGAPSRERWSWKRGSLERGSLTGFSSRGSVQGEDVLVRLLFGSYLGFSGAAEHDGRAEGAVVVVRQRVGVGAGDRHRVSRSPTRGAGSGRRLTSRSPDSHSAADELVLPHRAPRSSGWRPRPRSPGR